MKAKTILIIGMAMLMACAFAVSNVVAAPTLTLSTFGGTGLERTGESIYWPAYSKTTFTGTFSQMTNPVNNGMINMTFLTTLSNPYQTTQTVYFTVNEASGPGNLAYYATGPGGAEGKLTITISGFTNNVKPAVNTSNGAFSLQFYNASGGLLTAWTGPDTFTTNTAHTQVTDPPPLTGGGVNESGSVPEPATMAGLAGAALIAGLRRLRKKSR